MSGKERREGGRRAEEAQEEDGEDFRKPCPCARQCAHWFRSLRLPSSPLWEPLLTLLAVERSRVGAGSSGEREREREESKRRKGKIK